MFASIASTALVGIESQHVRVEVHAAGAPRPSFSIVGLPDTAVREARERVLSALASSGYKVPTGRVTVKGLAPFEEYFLADGTFVGVGVTDRRIGPLRGRPKGPPRDRPKGPCSGRPKGPSGPA